METVFLTDANIQIFNSFINANIDKSENYFFDISTGFDIKKEFSFMFIENGECAGVLLSGIKADMAHINLLLVDKKLRNRGIGKALLNKAIQYYQKHCIKIVRLEVFINNIEALQLYRSEGFREYKRIITYRNHSKTFYSSEKFEGLTIEAIDRFVLQPILTVFKIEENPTIRGYYTINNLLNDKTVNFVSIKDVNIEGFCIYKTDHFTLQIYDVRFKEYRKELMVFLLNSIVTTEKVVTIRGCYEGSPESNLYVSLGFYPESIQQEMRMEVSK